MYVGIYLSEILLDLLKEGSVSATCYKCNLPISHEEVKLCQCKDCGEICFDNILFRAIVPENLS